MFSDCGTSVDTRASSDEETSGIMSSSTAASPLKARRVTISRSDGHVLEGGRLYNHAASPTQLIQLEVRVSPGRL